MAAMNYGTPLGQIGQGWFHQGGGSVQYPNTNATGMPNPGGIGQTGNWMQDTGPMGGDAGGPVMGTAGPQGSYGAPGSPTSGLELPPGPAQFAGGQGVSATGPFMQNNAAGPTGNPSVGDANPGPQTGGAPSQQGLARSPASGGMFNFWGASQQSPMWGRAMNAAGFDGLGTGGQGPGARYWQRLNNIGGR